MRLWSIHPKYLDSAGLVALWREALLAKAVLEGKTKGYKNHPQLERFKAQSKPISAINEYLSYVLTEAKDRGFNFEETKVSKFDSSEKITVTDGQLKFEQEHLLIKLNIRDKIKHAELSKVKKPEPHPSVKIIKGPKADWEKGTGKKRQNQKN